MRAAIYRSFGGPIGVEQVPIPSTPADGVLVQVKATGVCRSDWHGWKGHDSDIIHHGLPFCPGHELSGVVVDVGPLIQKFQRGDRVAVPFILSCGHCHYCCANHSTVCLQQLQPGFTQWGSFAEYVAIPRADRNAAHIPATVSFVQAAALGCRFTTAYRAVVQQAQNVQPLMKTTTSKNDQKVGLSIAIFGCGGVGLSCIMIAAATAKSKQNGNIQSVDMTAVYDQIIAVDVSPHALQKARELGATHTVLASKDDDAQKQHVLDLTWEQQGADVTVDAAGFASTCQAAIACTRRGGRMVQVGLPSPAPQINMTLIAGRELEVVGSHGFAAQDLPKLLDWVATNKFDPARLVERCVSLEQGAQALQDMDHGSPLGITMVTQFTDAGSSGYAESGPPRQLTCSRL